LIPDGKGRRDVDCIYIAAFSRDARLTRICVASIRYYYPDVPIRVLAGSPLMPDLIRELRDYWNTSVARWQEGDYGSGFVKLETLFGPQGERFMVIDADTVIVGPVLDLWREDDPPFLMDEETLPDGEMKRLYYDWDNLSANGLPTPRPLHVYNTGQWFGTAGVVDRSEFDDLIEWSMPRQLHHPKFFMTGDQGTQNYVFNRMAHRGRQFYGRRTIMRWPPHGMSDVTLEAVRNRTAPPVVVHWAGLKKRRISDMVNPELLIFFEKYYYSRIPMGGLLRHYRAVMDVFWQWFHNKKVRIRQRFNNRRPVY